MTKEKFLKEKFYDMTVLLFFFVGLEFPGKYAAILSNKLEPLLAYSAFLFEIIAIIISSGEKWGDFVLFKLEKKYFWIYSFIVVIAFVSLINTKEYVAQSISIIHVGTTIIFSVWIAERYPIKKIVDFWCRALEAITLLLLLYWAIKPDKSFSMVRGEKSYCGFYESKNSCASILSFAVLLLFISFLIYIEEREQISSFRILIWLIDFVLLVMCNAKASLFFSVIPCIYGIFYLKTNRKVPFPGPVYALSSIGFLICALTVLPVFKPFFDMLGKDITLTGRVPLWNRCLTVITHSHFMTGFGYGQFWLNRKSVALINAGFRRNTFFNGMSSGSHNVMIELLLNIGFIGVTVYLTMCIVLLDKAKYLKRDEYILVICFMMSFMIHGFTERSFFTYDYQTLTVFLVLAICANAQIPHIPQRRKKVNLEVSL